MSVRKNATVMLILLLILSTLSIFVAQSPLAQGSPSPDPADRTVELVFTVDPDGWVEVKGTLVDTNVTTSPENFTLSAAFSLMGSEANKNLTLVLSQERASEFPFNTTSLSLSKNYAQGELLNTDLNFSLIFPENMSQYLPPGEGAEMGMLLSLLLNNTDFVLDEMYSEGDIQESVQLTMTVNVTDLLGELLPLPIGFEAPFTLDLNYTKGEYDGTLTLYLLPGLPVGDAEIDIKGNLTDVCFNGTVSVSYGTFNGMEINASVLDMIEYYAENIFNASIDTEGSLLNQSQGRYQCSYINVERQNVTGGEDVTFKVCISEAMPGEFLFIPFNLVPETAWDEQPLELMWLYRALNDTLHKSQDASLRIVYTPADTRLHITLNETVHLRELVEQLLEPIVIPEERQTYVIPPIINSTNLPCVWWAVSMLNATVNSFENSSLQVAYTHGDRRLEINHTSFMDLEGLLEDLNQTFFELPPECIESMGLPPEAQLPPNVTQLIASLSAVRYVNVTSAQAVITYANGRFSYIEGCTLEGDINTQLNAVKTVLIDYLNMTSGPLPWQVWYLNNTLIEVANLKVNLKVDNVSSLTGNVEGIMVKPTVEPVNATAFKLYKFFNLTKEMPFPGQDEQLRVTVIGGTNGTHKVALYNETWIPEPDQILLNPKNRATLMTWDNVTLSDLRELRFIIDEPPTAVTLSTPTTDDITTNSISLTWSENQDTDFDRYEIFLSTSSDGPWTSIANITARSTTSHTEDSLSHGTTYFFTVRVWDSVGLHADSNQISVATKLPIWLQWWFWLIIIAVGGGIAAVIFYKRRSIFSRQPT